MNRFVHFAFSYLRNVFALIFHGFVSGARSLVVEPTRVYLCPRLHQYRPETLLHRDVDEMYVGSADLVTRPRDLYDRLLECIMQNDTRKVHDIISGDQSGILRQHRSGGEHSRDNDTFPLLLATMLGNAKIVSLLLAGGVDPNCKLEGTAFLNTRCPTALHQAVEDGHLEIVKILTGWQRRLDRSARSLDVQNCDGETALHIAVEDGTFEMVNALLAGGCDVNVADCQGSNALHVALSSNRCSAAVIKALVAYGVDINVPSGSGITPARHAALTGNLSAVALLLAAGCDLKFNSTAHLSPLEAAIIRQDLQSMQAILSSQKILQAVCDPTQSGAQRISAAGGGSTHTSDPSGDISDLQYVDESVHFAARYGNSEIMGVVLRYKSDQIDSYNSQGETPLFVAVRHSNVQTLRVLLDCNANANQTSLHGISCLCKATLDCNFTAVLYLVIFADVDYGLEMNSAAIHKALFCGFHNIAGLLIQCGCTLNNSALHLVLSSKDWGLMPLIHSAGYDYFARTVAVQMVKHERRVNSDVFDWAVSVLSGPNSLQDHCRVVIRNSMRGQLYAKVQTLNLPKVTKQYLMLGPLCSSLED